MLSRRIVLGASLIEEKLQRQFAHAQIQALAQSDGDFVSLSAPTSFLANAHTEGEAGICHYIGRRPTMEDEHLVSTFNLTVREKTYPIRLFGVFDGHGGSEASRFVKDNLESILSQTLNETCASALTDEAVWNALKIALVRLDESFGSRLSGTTATVAMILDGKLWVANTGDSRTILDNGLQLSEDAKPTDIRYRRGIEKRGCFVAFGRINGRLAVARAIGDSDIGPINARPKITVIPLPKDTHLILACDGIYDVASTRQIAAAVKASKGHASPQEIAANLVYSAYQAGSTDNLSALVVRLP